MVKADGSVSVHADDRAYKPLNWMSAPCNLHVETDPEMWADEPWDDGVTQLWTVRAKSGDQLKIAIWRVESDSQHDLGIDPGLVKDGVEAHLQALLAQFPEHLADGLTLVQREYPTAIGPVDLLCRTSDGRYVAVEVKRRGEIDGVEQLTRYLDLLGRDPLLGGVTGILAAQQIKPQAKTLASDRQITCVTVDYDVLRGMDDPSERLF